MRVGRGRGRAGLGMARSAHFVSELAVQLKQRLEKPASVRPWPQLYRAVCSVPSFVIEVSGSDADNNGQATFSGN